MCIRLPCSFIHVTSTLPCRLHSHLTGTSLILITLERRRISGCRLSLPKNSVCELEPRDQLNSPIEYDCDLRTRDAAGTRRRQKTFGDANVNNYPSQSITSALRAGILVPFLLQALLCLPFSLLVLLA